MGKQKVFIPVKQVCLDDNDVVIVKCSSKKSLIAKEKELYCFTKEQIEELQEKAFDEGRYSQVAENYSDKKLRPRIKFSDAKEYINSLNLK